MITHYDMLTSEVIEDGSQQARDDRESHHEQELQLRLLSVHEATMTEQRIAATAPAVIMLPIDYLLGR